MDLCQGLLQQIVRRRPLAVFSFLLEVLSFLLLSVNHVWTYISAVSRRILTKLCHKDPCSCPNMAYDFDLSMNFDLDTGVKNVILL